MLQIGDFLLSSVSDGLGPLLDCLPEVGEAPVSVGDHLVRVAGHQPLQRVPHYHKLQILLINQLQLIPVLIKRVMTISQHEDPFQVEQGSRAEMKSRYEDSFCDYFLLLW